MFLIALIIGAIGFLFTALGKSLDSTAMSFFGGLACLASGIMFIANAFI